MQIQCQRLHQFCKELPDFFKTFSAIILDALSPSLPRDLKKSPNYSAVILSSETATEVLLSQIEQKLFNTLLSLKVLTPERMFCDISLPATNTMGNSFVF